MFRYILVLAFLASSFFAEAGHLIGGEISYEQINGDTYVVSLRIYRDCYASGVNVATRFDFEVNISIYDASSNELIRVMQIDRPNDSIRLPLVVEVPCLPDPPDICVLEIVYSDTLIIDVPPNGVYLVNQRCCRTPDVLNIINPRNFGSTYSTYIPGSNLFHDNSSPKFNKVPPIALCAGIYLELDYSATDLDSDSLYYDLCTPFHGGGSGSSSISPTPDTPAAPPFDTIAWKNGFNKNYQLSSAPPFEIDHNKGIISGRPDQIGSYAFGVCVSEYREGLKISENRRDFQMEVTPCDVEAAAAIDSAVEECIGLKIQFYNKSTLGESFYWDFGDPTTNTDTSTKQDPMYTYPDTGFYTIRLIAVGAVGCSDTTYFTYHVRPRIIPDFVEPDKFCFENHSFDFEHGGVAKPTTLKYWVIRNDTIVIEPDQIGIYDQTFPNLGNHNVQLVYKDFGCVKIKSINIPLYETPEVSINQPFKESCIPFVKKYSVEKRYAGKPSFMWYVSGKPFSKKENPTLFLDESGYYDLQVVMITDSMCVDTVESHFDNHILVLDQPYANFGLSQSRVDMFEPFVQVTDSSFEANYVEFYLNQEFISNNNWIDLTLPDTGNFIIKQLAYNESGCIDSMHNTLRVLPELLIYLPNSFTPNGDLLNDTWQPRIFASSYYSLMIRDRWGHIVFESEDPNVGWDGKQKNEDILSPIGLYFYQIRVADPEGRILNYDGPITLYR